MDDNYDSYDYQNAPASDSQAVSAPVSSGDATGTTMGAMDSSTPIGSQAELSQLLYGGQDSSQSAPPSLESAIASIIGTPAANGSTGTNQLSSTASPLSAIFNAAKDSQSANEAPSAGISAGGSGAGAISQLLKGLGISGDLSSPKNLESMMKLLMGAGGVLGTLNRKGTAQNAMSPQQMLQSVSPNGSSFSPTQQSFANNYFNTPTSAFATRPRQYAADMQSPIVAGVGTNGMAPAKFADGGMVNPGLGDMPANPAQYPYDPAMPQPTVSNNYADGGKVDNGKFVSDGALSLVHGLGGGQDDLVHAKLSPGEYVMDADTVASLGDGNNAHGAKVLDAWREQLRAHKRSADSDSIPPQAKEPNHYLKGGALSAVHNSKGK